MNAGLMLGSAETTTARQNNNEMHSLVQLMTLLMQELRGTLNTNPKIDLILEKLEVQHEEYKKLQDRIDKLSIQVEQHSKALNELQNMNLSKSTSQVTSSPQTHQNISTLDRGIRKNNLIITGLEIGSEDPKIFIQAFLSARFPTVHPDGLLAAQKIGTTVKQIEAPSRYLITLKSYWDAQLIYNQRLKALRNDNIYISEDLTPSETRLFYKARQLKKAQIIYTTWTKDGRTFFKRNENDSPEELNERDPILSNITTAQTPTPPNSIQIKPVVIDFPQAHENKQDEQENPTQNENDQSTEEEREESEEDLIKVMSKTKRQKRKIKKT